jgi:hypothetical protein
MRYGTWNILFNEDITLGGTTPNELDGAFFCDELQTKIAGYIPDNIDINTLSDWSVEEITEQEFINFIINKNPEGLLIDGKAVFPQILLI